MGLQSYVSVALVALLISGCGTSSPASRDQAASVPPNHSDIQCARSAKKVCERAGADWRACKCVDYFDMTFIGSPLETGFGYQY